MPWQRPWLCGVKGFWQGDMSDAVERAASGSLGLQTRLWGDLGYLGHLHSRWGGTRSPHEHPVSPRN